MMKRTTLLIIGVLVATTTLMAQKESAEANTADRTKERTERLRSELNLSQEQAEQLNAIHSRYSDERKEIREVNRKEREAQKDQMRTLHERQREEVRAILTEEQRGRFDSLHEERTNRGESRHRRSHGKSGRG